MSKVFEVPSFFILAMVVQTEGPDPLSTTQHGMISLSSRLQTRNGSRHGDHQIISRGSTQGLFSKVVCDKKSRCNNSA